MTARTYYVLCEDNCRFEGMTKEQIYDAIAEATGATPTLVDQAFITQIKEQNAQHNIKVWKGTQAQYNALASKSADTLYFIDTNVINTNFVDMVYPVGSLYWSNNSTNPASLFGGTWQQIKDVFVLAAGDTYSVDETGGEATHTLTTQEMPEHRHKALLENQGSSSGGIKFSASGASGGYFSGAYIDSEGGGQAHNNMPPYVVKYCWERTA